jgi:hypothetical protein
VNAKLWAASFLLPFGVAFAITGSLHVANLWWVSVIGYILLMILPALIADGIADYLKDR